MQCRRARGPAGQIAAAIGASAVPMFGACCAEGAFERADKGTWCLRRKVGSAGFAIRSHFKHEHVFRNC